MKGALSQSCPYLYDKRRGSFSSVASQRTGVQHKKQVIWHLLNFQSNVLMLLVKVKPFCSFRSSYQSNLKARKEAKKSNVTLTMIYLGQGHRVSGLGPTQDELKVLQQVNGGENICVFKGLVTPGGRSCEIKLFWMAKWGTREHLAFEIQLKETCLYTVCLCY